MLISGANGSGKSTLSKLLIGLLHPDSGEIMVDEKPLDKIRPTRLGEKLGYVFQEYSQNLATKTIHEEMLLKQILENSVTKEDVEAAKNLIGAFDLKKSLDTEVYNLSAGEKQRLALASMFFVDRDYYILDEPFSRIDKKREELVERYILSRVDSGSGILLITHKSGLLNSKCTKHYIISGCKLYEN